MKPQRVRLSLAALVVGIWLHPSPALPQTTAQTAPQPNPERQAFFGETHVHTSWSFDAFIFGNHVTGPADAYKYAGRRSHPLGYDIKITTRSTGWASPTTPSTSAPSGWRTAGVLSKRRSEAGTTRPTSSALPVARHLHIEGKPA